MQQFPINKGSIMIIGHQNFFYTLGWSDAKVLLAQDILVHGTQTQRNKLFSEVAPQARSLWSRA